jgi:hypothetical protein
VSSRTCTALIERLDLPSVETAAHPRTTRALADVTSLTFAATGQLSVQDEAIPVPGHEIADRTLNILVMAYLCTLVGVLLQIQEDDPGGFTMALGTALALLSTVLDRLSSSENLPPGG